MTDRVEVQRYKITPVILAGGAGTRLWPLSTGNRPKQFVKLFGKHSLFQNTLLRLRHMPYLAPSLVITGQAYHMLCREQMKEVGMVRARFILEPFGRSTAPAIALAAYDVIKTVGAGGMMLIMPSDHFLKDVGEFAEAVSSAVAMVKAGYIVTFGIIPTSPEREYGYIRSGSPLKNMSGRRVRCFVEKPTKERAVQFIATKEYFWNSGMFFCRAEVYLKELCIREPAIGAVCKVAYERSSEGNDVHTIDPKDFIPCPDRSIDYAVMEKTEKGALLPLASPWRDLGTWATVADHFFPDVQGNIVYGHPFATACKDSVLYGRAGERMYVFGLTNRIVVSTDRAVLIADKFRIQEIKKIVAGLSSPGQGAATGEQALPNSLSKWHRVKKQDNLLCGSIVTEECSGCMLHALDDRLIAAVGVRNVCVVSAKGALFLMDGKYCEDPIKHMRRLGIGECDAKIHRTG